MWRKHSRRHAPVVGMRRISVVPHKPHGHVRRRPVWLFQHLSQPCKIDPHASTALRAGWAGRASTPAAAIKQEDGCIAAARILDRWTPPVEKDWRTWNRGRTRAWQVVEEATAEMSVMACALE